MTFVKNTKKFNPADTIGSMRDKCPTHDTECAKTWEEIIKDFPAIVAEGTLFEKDESLNVIIERER